MVEGVFTLTALPQGTNVSAIATALDNVPENGLTICDRVRIIRIMPRWLAEVMILIHLNLILAAFDMTVNVIAMLCGIVLQNKPVSSEETEIESKHLLYKNS